jgi:hypothetical protein
MDERARDRLVSLVKKHGTEQDIEFLNSILIVMRATEVLKHHKKPIQKKTMKPCRRSHTCNILPGGRCLHASEH